MAEKIYTLSELQGLKQPELLKLATELHINIKGITRKEQLVQSILTTLVAQEPLPRSESATSLQSLTSPLKVDAGAKQKLFVDNRGDLQDVDPYLSQQSVQLQLELQKLRFQREERDHEFEIQRLREEREFQRLHEEREFQREEVKKGRGRSEIASLNDSVKKVKEYANMKKKWSC